MCGIAGIVGDPQGGEIRRMTQTLAHRGPDGEGYFLSPRAQLGHRRLSIIDLETGQQPITTYDGRFTLVFNGEIYNYRELKHDLESYGATFRTLSDSEVLLQAYARWGRAAIEKLRGMFAFAVWDSHQQHLFAARDRLGLKPFYYAQCSHTLLFASEMKALLVHSEMKRELDECALDDYLTYLYVPAPRTIFRHIRELPPAHWLEWRNRSLRIGQYWDVAFEPEPNKFSSSVKELSARLEEAVSTHLTSDLPVGVFLSGGLDSSSIAALMARQLRTPVKSFTLGFSEEGKWYDERRYARQISEAIGLDAREQRVGVESADLLTQVTRQFDEPFGNPTSLLVYQLAAAGRRHLKIALTGDGGDEALLGYPRYRGLALAQQYRKAPRLLREAMSRSALHWHEPASGKHFRRRLREFLSTGVLPPERMYFDWVSYFSSDLRQSLYTPELKQRLGSYDSSQFIADLFRKSCARELIDQANYVDLHSFLPHNVLRYADRMSMAHGLEIRCPLTDHRLIEFLARVPWRHKLQIMQSKRLLRTAAKAWLPRPILKRPKLGLNPPLGLWFQHRLQPMLRAYLAPERIRQRGYFRSETVQRLIHHHASGRRDYSLHLWALISFEEWHRQYLDQPGIQPLSSKSPASPILQLV
jgi:asparagine synthase (glutamine-hydrolysing)